MGDRVGERPAWRDPWAWFGGWALACGVLGCIEAKDNTLRFQALQERVESLELRSADMDDADTDRGIPALDLPR